MTSDGDRTLLQLFRQGSQAAAQELYERYVDRLIPLARNRLSGRLARRVDAQDVVQSVFRTFFARARNDRFSIEGPDDVYKLLCGITLRKALRQVAYHTAAKRDVHRESVVTPYQLPEAGQKVDPTPSPLAVNAFIEQLEDFVEQLRPEQRQILELRLEGYGPREIAQRLGILEHKVFYLQRLLRDLAERSLLEEC
jgi:RNA polymerase sigma-70 factor (ECF subfamily)